MHLHVHVHVHVHVHDGMWEEGGNAKFAHTTTHITQIQNARAHYTRATHTEEVKSDSI